MGTTRSILCIHRDPEELRVLEQGGYELVSATNVSDGLRLFMARAVDAIVLDYHLGLLDGGAVASVVKQVKPQVPIVMFAEKLDVPVDALVSVDAIVTRRESPDTLLATLSSLLVAIVRPQQEEPEQRQTEAAQLTAGEKAAPFSPKQWRDIRNGTIQFGPVTGGPH